MLGNIQNNLVMDDAREWEISINETLTIDLTP